MSIWPTTIKKIDSGKNLLIKFDNNDEFTVSAELLRVECPSADVQGHGGPKIIVRNKSDVVINSIEQIGNYAIRIIFSDDHSSGLFSWDLLHDYGINHDLYLNKYYKSLNLI
ncbi:gamma-butyrobetaine hydroxylase-like domain-containing protein [Alphaproteobacteria bacterium]|nr:gamma-butyrobetaine hydroxylase-like domain-containing protein [Alphaproteobacteria bacterium]